MEALCKSYGSRAASLEMSLPSMVESLAVETVLDVSRTLLWILSLMSSLSSETGALGTGSEVIDGRIPVAATGKSRAGPVPENKEDGDSEDDGEDEEDEDDGDDQDGVGAEEDPSGDEGNGKEGDEEGGDDPEANGEGGSEEDGDDDDDDDDDEGDDDDDDDGEDEDDEEEDDEDIPQPPAKKRK